MGELAYGWVSKIPFALWSRSKASQVTILASFPIGHKLTLALDILWILGQEKEGKNKLKDKYPKDAQGPRGMGKLSEKGSSKNTGNPKTLGYADPTVFNFLSYNTVDSMITTKFHALSTKPNSDLGLCPMSVSPLRDGQKRVLSSS